MTTKEQVSHSLYAAILGDTLGVPVEHSSRQELALTAVKNMLGFGRYDQPAGTFSDDSSMILCTMDSLLNGYDLNALAQSFCGWLFESKWTATGYVFDSGLTTFMALESIRSEKKSPRESGGTSIDDNGNGSLMRMLPAALYLHAEPLDTFLTRIHEVSAITHAHPRAMMGCGVYALVIRALLSSGSKEAAFPCACKEATEWYSKHNAFAAELPQYGRVLSGDIISVPRDDISSSGYVIHTLEAAIWCLFRHATTADILLEAVNLGLDTDTTGTVAGGLAGLCHGLSGVPSSWLDTLARKNEIDELIARFIATIPAEPAA